MIAAMVVTMFGASAASADPPLRLRLHGMSMVVPLPLIDGGSDVDRSRRITVRSDSGASTTALAGGTSAAQLVRLVGIPLPMVESIEVQQGFGRTVRISGDEVRNGFSGDPGVCGSPCPAVFDAGYNDDTVNFYRPLRSATDANARDNLAPAGGSNPETLFVAVDTVGEELGVDLTLDDNAPAAGQSVVLRAKASASGGGSEPSFTWYFGDGTTATGESVRHTWNAGRWTVGVVASTANSYGAAARSLIVDAPAAAATPTPVPTKAPSNGGDSPSTDDGAGGSNGGAKSKGSGSGDSDSPADGADDAPVKGDTPSRSSDRSGKGTGTSTPVATPAPTATARGGGATLTPAATATPTPAAGPAAASPDLTRISGRLVNTETARSLDAALTAADALAREDAPKPSSIARAGAGGGRSVVGSAASGMLLIGLLGAGALTEWRRARRASLQP